MRIKDFSLQPQQLRYLLSVLTMLVLVAAVWVINDLYGSIAQLRMDNQQLSAALSAVAAVDVTDNDNIPRPDEVLPPDNDTISVSAGVQDNVQAAADGDQLPPPGSGTEQFAISLSRAGGSEGREISRAYGYDYNPNTEDYRFHRGCDTDLPPDSAVYAPAAATVAEAYTDQYWGGVVVLDHGNGWRSVYKCLLPEVSAGQELEAGAVLGKITRAPAEAVQDYHLHIELEHDGSSENPANYW